MKKQKPVLTVISFALVIAANLLGWGILIWTKITVNPQDMFGYIPVMSAVPLFLIIDFIALLLLFIAVGRNESTMRLGKWAHYTGLVSPIVYLFGIFFII